MVMEKCQAAIIGKVPSSNYSNLNSFFSSKYIKKEKKNLDYCLILTLRPNSPFAPSSGFNSPPMEKFNVIFDLIHIIVIELLQNSPIC